MTSILFVDDDQQNLDSLLRRIRFDNLDWNIYTAINEDEAENILENNTIYVVVTDLVMKTESSGLEVLKISKRIDELRPVIIVTGYEQDLNRYNAFKAGAFDCVARNTPGIITVEEILIKTKAAIEFRRLLEKEKRLDFLKRYFDPSLFSEIEKNPEILSVRSKILTICFWDIRGFSKLCETLKQHPAQVSDFLEAYFRAASESVFKYNGVIDKFIGDGVMAIFGVMNNATDDDGRGDAVFAINAALDLRVKFNQFHDEWIEKWSMCTAQKINIGLGCGIHTGESIIGNIGTDLRSDFTALGPHVNLAARLESRADSNQILISNTTKARVQKCFTIKNCGIIDDIKNIHGEYEVYEIISPGVVD